MIEGFDGSFLIKRECVYTVTFKQNLTCIFLYLSVYLKETFQCETPCTMLLHFCRPREIAGDPNCSGDASTSTLLPTESRDEIDVAELQSELLVLLCPTLGKESDEVRRQSLLGNGTGNVSTGTGNSIQQSV